MATEIPKQTDIEFAAKIFAKEFVKSGIGGRSANVSKINSANTGGGGVTLGDSGEGVDDTILNKVKNKLLKENNKALKDYVDIQKDVSKSTKLSEKQKKKLAKIEKKMATDADTLGDAFVQTAKEFKDGKLSAKDVKEFIGKDISKLSRDFGDELEDAGDEVVKGVTNIGRGLEAAGGWLENTVSSFAIKAAGTATVKNFVDQLSSTLKYGGSVIGGLNTAWDAFKLGISPSDLLELETKNKKLVAGMGGAAKFAENLNEISDQNFKNYGDLGEAVKGSTQILTAFSLGGVKASDAMDGIKNSAAAGLTNTFKEIQAATGQTFAEQAAAMEEYVKNDNIRNRLIGASNSAERRNVIERGLANKRLLVGLGLTAEQAARAGEALHGVAGMDPKERLKEAYKAQAVMEAMGIENAHLVREAFMAGGVENLAPEKQADAIIALAQAKQKGAASKSGDMRGGGLPGMLTDSALLGKMGGEFQAMINGVGDVNLTDPVKAKAEIDRKMSEQKADEDSVFAPLVTGALEIGQMVTTGLATNAILTGIAGGVLLITKLLMMKAGRRGALGGLGEMFMGKKKDAMGLGKKPGLFGKAAGVVGGGIGKAADVVGGGIGKAAGAIAGSGAGKIAGGLLSKGAGLLKVLGPIGLIGGAVFGAIQGINDAGEHFKGREITAGMKATSALGGIISNLTFGFVDAGAAAKGLYSIFDDGEKTTKKAAKAESKRFQTKMTSESMMKMSLETGGSKKRQARNSRKIKQHKKDVKGMSEDEFNEAMGQAGGDKKLRQFLIQSRFAGGESVAPVDQNISTRMRGGGRNAPIQAPIGSAKTLNVANSVAAKAGGGRNSGKAKPEDSEVSALVEATLLQNEKLDKLIESNEKGVNVNKQQLKTSNDMKRNQEVAAEIEEPNNLGFGNANV